MKKDLPSLLKMDQELQGKRCGFSNGAACCSQYLTYFFFLMRRKRGYALSPHSQSRVDVTAFSRFA